jgi:hypothetical protein
MGFFNSPLQDAIEKATDEKIGEPNWNMNMQICDAVLREPKGYVSRMFCGFE